MDWYPLLNSLRIAVISAGIVFFAGIAAAYYIAKLPRLLKGVLDALRAGVIYDVKFLNKSLGSADVYGKWLNCTQHPAYFYLVPEAHEFQYVGSDGSDVYIETYQRDQTPYIGEIIHDFLEFLKGEGLMDVFAERWEV
jgi:hypothetical protein